MTLAELRAELDEMITEANTDAAESHKTAMNSYGAGYDCGYRDALKDVLSLVDGEEE